MRSRKYLSQKITIKVGAVRLLVAVECHVLRDPLEGDVIVRGEVGNAVEADSVILSALQRPR